MASLTKETRHGNAGWRLRFFIGEKRVSLRFGKISKRAAEEITRHINSLLRTHELGLPIENDTYTWLIGVDADIHDKLVEWGLCETRGTAGGTEAGRLLGPFMAAYVASRLDLKPGSLEIYKQVERKLNDFFGERRSLRSITPADAQRWKQSMMATMADGTVSKNLKKAKTMFKSAVEDKYIAVSPFDSVRGLSETNRARFAFVTRVQAEAVIAKCPDIDWKLIFALPRYAGMRCPSEVKSLRWTDIDFKKKIMRIDAPKTGVRFCPIFPRILELLKEAKENENAHPTFVLMRHRMDKNMGTHMKRIIAKAGIKPWPKVFVNLRSTRRTELQEKYPSHVIDAWLGQSTHVAELHYLQVMPEHWTRAIDDENT